MIQDRKLLIFGNGLGMAMDPNHFSLENALKQIWNTGHFWNSRADRGLIRQCIPNLTHPKSEDDMDKLHLAAVSCNFLKDLPSYRNNTHWLSDNGFSFPEVTQKYIHTVATYLHNTNHVLPKKFERELHKFIKKTKSHVATLNYDKLLYESFIYNKITDGYSGYLVDGILRTGFNEDHLERRFNNDFGYYLHLHGSPLFYENNRVIHKNNINSLDIDNCYPSKHIVLTHIKHKPSVIANSEILSTYWRYLHLALSEVDEVILFGYSGLDIHLNKLLKMNSKTKFFRVIEWSGTGDIDERYSFWQNEISNNLDLEHFNNITNFIDWN